MRILVTGGAGFIGSVTSHYLISKKHDVIVYDNLVYGHEWAVPKKARFVKGEIEDKEKLKQVLKEESIDAVMHFAAYTNVRESVEKPKKYYRNNVYGSLCLLESMVEEGVKNIVFSSSCATFGTPKETPINENQRKAPINPYGVSKLIIEGMLKDFEKAYGIKHSILRYFNAAGADYEIGESHDPETHLIPLILDVAIGKKEKLTVFGNNYDTPDGTCVRDYIHITDLAEAHLLALEKLIEKQESNDYNLGTEQGSSVLEIIRLCEEATGKKINYEIGAAREGDPARLIADSTKIKKELNYQTKKDIKEIIKSAWEWHKKDSKEGI